MPRRTNNRRKRKAQERERNMRRREIGRLIQDLRAAWRRQRKDSKS